LTFFVTAVLLLRLMPVLVRLAERAVRHAPTGARLAFLGAARRPAQAALATTFLAVAVGAATFSLDYRSTLEHQTRDQANFTAGGLWRVVESSSQRQPVVAANGVVTQPVESATDVAPLTRYAAVSQEQPTPVLRLAMQQLNTSAGSNQAGVPVTLLGIPTARLNEIRGWRAGFSSASRAELTRRLAAHTVSAPGPASARRRRLAGMGQNGRDLSTEVAFWFLLPGQDTRVVRVAVVAPSQWKLVRFPLPHELRGTQLIGIDLNPVTQGFG